MGIPEVAESEVVDDAEKLRNEVDDTVTCMMRDGAFTVCVLRIWRLPCSCGRCSYGCVQHPVCTSVEQPGLKRARTDGTNMDTGAPSLSINVFLSVAISI